MNKKLHDVTPHFACAFCDGWYSVVAHDDGKIGTVADHVGVAADIGAAHSVPACDAFGLLEPDHFAVASRLAWQHLRGQVPPLHGAP